MNTTETKNTDETISKSKEPIGQTKKCKYCKSEIDKKAKVCPICRKKQKKHHFFAIAFILIIIIAIGGVIAANDDESDSPKQPNISMDDSKNSSSQTDTLSAEEITTTSDSSSSKLSIAEQVLFEYSGLKVTAKEIVDDSFWGTGISFLIENNSTQNLGINCNALIVNNYMVSDGLFSSSVAAGKKANETLYFDSNGLKASGINNIGQLEIYFHVYNSDTYDGIYDSDCITIHTSNYDTMNISKMDDGVELLNQNGVRIVGKYVDEDSFWGTAVLLYIENNSGANITVNCDNMSVNGYMVNPLYSSTVYNEKMMVDNLTILSSDLKNNNIDKIENIELQFNVFNSDTYDTIFDSDPIAFNVD